MRSDGDIGLVFSAGGANGGWDEKGGENTPVTPIWKDNPDIKTLVVIRCNSVEADPMERRH